MSKSALDIEQLSPSERLELIAQLWDSLSDDDVLLTDAQRQELDRRLDSLDREGPVGVSWEQVRDEMAVPRNDRSITVLRR
jgi:putative addiction module component (TIGR02574 family)